MTTSLLLTEPQAAAELTLSERTLRKARKAGDLRYVLIGRSVRYTMADLEAFIAAKRTREQPCQPPKPKPKRTANGRRSGEIIPFSQRA